MRSEGVEASVGAGGVVGFDHGRESGRIGSKKASGERSRFCGRERSGSNRVRTGSVADDVCSRLGSLAIVAPEWRRRPVWLSIQQTGRPAKWRALAGELRPSVVGALRRRETARRHDFGVFLSQDVPSGTECGDARAGSSSVVRSARLVRPKGGTSRDSILAPLALRERRALRHHPFRPWFSRTLNAHEGFSPARTTRGRSRVGRINVGRTEAEHGGSRARGDRRR